MRFEWYVAQRYLRSPYRPAVLRLVTMFSIIGVAAGVATLVIALSMNTGFRETLQDRLLGVTAHISHAPPPRRHQEQRGEVQETLRAARSSRCDTPGYQDSVSLFFGADTSCTETK